MAGFLRMPTGYAFVRSALDEDEDDDRRRDGLLLLVPAATRNAVRECCRKPKSWSSTGWATWGP